MRIQFFITGLGPGGAERQLTGLASMLTGKGYEVEVCWYTDINFYEQYLLQNSVACRRLYTRNHFKKIWNIKSAIKAFRPDVVISFLDGPNTICPLMKILNRRFKLIVSERNTTLIQDWRSRLRFALYRWADRIVPNSDSQKQFILNHYPAYVQKTITITNFTDLHVFNCPEQSYSEITNIMVAARLTEPKNVKRFISAISILHKRNVNIRVKWFGKAFLQTYEKECEELVKAEGLTDIFQIMPPTRNIVEEYKACDVVCLPSLHEGFPNVVCEAMSCGRPVLCSNICDNSTLVSDGLNGYLFDPYSPKDMADKIEKFCSLSKENKILMGRNSRQKAEKILSKERFLNRYVELIESL